MVPFQTPNDPSRVEAEIIKTLYILSCESFLVTKKLTKRQNLSLFITEKNAVELGILFVSDSKSAKVLL